MNALISDEVLIRTICAYCGKAKNGDAADWHESVNLTPDTFFLGLDAREFGRAIVELDIAFDWCDVVCFGRWLFRAAAVLGSTARPE